MRVLIFHYTPVSANSVHAQVLQVESFADALRRRGATVVVCARRRRGNYRIKPNKSGGVIRSIIQPLRGYGLKSLLKNLVDLPKEVYLIRNYGPDVVVIWFVQMGFSPFVASRLLRIPSIAFMDGPIAYIDRVFFPHSIPFKLPELIEKICCKMANLVVTVSEISKEMLLKNCMHSSKIHVCPNGVDLEMFRPLDGISEVRRSLGWDDKFVFGFFGAFQVWHNPEELVWVIKEAARVRPQARFLLVGDGPYKKEVESTLREERLAGYVHMTGNVPREDVVCYLQAMDASLAPYVKHESFFLSPMKVVESMAVGVPVLTTAQGELIHLINDGVNGFLYDCGDRATLLEKAIKMIDNPDMCHNMGCEARRKVEAERSWDQVAGPLWEAISLAAKKG